MVTVMLNIPAELLREVEELARLEERTRQAQLRYLVRLGLAVVKARRHELAGLAAGQEHQPHQGGEADAEAK